MKLPKNIIFADEFEKLKDALFLHDDGFRFIKFHKIWRGFASYGWASKILMVIGILFSLSFFGIILDWIKHIYDEGGNIVANTSSMLLDIKELVFLEGGIKYIILIALEILIFHCSVKTLNILHGQHRVPKFEDFRAAVKRMIKVALRAFILETILVFIIAMLLSMFGLDIINFIPKFFIEAYFVGFAFFDNYNEQFGFNIKDSQEQIHKMMGAVIGIGMVAVLLFKLPIIGAVAAPMLGAVTATMYLHGEGHHWPTLPRLFHEDKLKLKPLKEKIKA